MSDINVAGSIEKGFDKISYYFSIIHNQYIFNPYRR